MSVKILDLHEWYDHFLKLTKERKQDIIKNPKPVYLETTVLPSNNSLVAFRSLDKFFSEKPRLIIALDQVTDVHNAAAIMRTAAFYRADLMVVENKNEGPLPPPFFKIASGATEHVTLWRFSHLSRFIQKCKQHNVLCLGFSENGIDEQLLMEKLNNENKLYNKHLMLVVGSEEKGISPAILRLLDCNIKLESESSFQTLNVSAASAVIFERYKNILKKQLD
jgi:23S rRNA (guanosine2251-2'-O)-methyltransferase